MCINLVFLFSFHSLHHAPGAENNEGYAQDLSHIQWQRTIVRTALQFLGELDEEASREDQRKAEAEIEAGTHLFLRSLIEPPSHEEEHSVAQCLVELSRMTWKRQSVLAQGVHCLARLQEAEGPWNVRHAANNLAVHQVTHADEEGADRRHDGYVVEYENFTRHYASESEVSSLLKMNLGNSSGKYSFSKGSTSGNLSVTFAEPERSYGLSVGEEGSFAEDNELPDGLVYQIQIFVLSKTATVKQLKGVSPVYDHKLSGGKHLYAAGLFRTYAEAKAALPKVKNAGFPNALIIAYRDGKSLSVNRARQLESQITVLKEEVHIVK